jgi:transmembrane sensor
MNKVSKYAGYTVEDFVEDKDFRCWVSYPTEILDTFWSDFQRNHSEKVQEIEQARKIIQTIFFEEGQISKKQIQDSLEPIVEHLTQRIEKKNRFLSFTYNLGKVAAVVLILLIPVNLYFAYQNRSACTSAQLVKYFVPNGQRSNLVLADGTKVWINSGSMFSVSSGYSKNNRKVYLTGEAFFKVSKDNKHPFLVETKDYTVKVSGTEFNVMAYDHMKTSETVLKEGSVSILTGSGKEIKISPGQRYFLPENKQYSISEVDPNIYSAWKDNVFKINNEKLQDLIIKMEHWYGVNIKVEDFNKVKDLRYTLTIKTESLREMLSLMSLVTPFTFRVEGENVNLKYNLK